MPSSRNKLLATSVLLLGVGVVVVAGITLYPEMRERYWIWRLESGTWTEREEAAGKLADISSVRAIPVLIDAFVAALERSGDSWWIDRNTSELYLYSVTIVDTPVQIKKLDYAQCPYLTAIQIISNRTPETTIEVLRAHLSDNREIVRAVAASVLFRNKSGAQKYVSRERLCSFF